MPLVPLVPFTMPLEQRILLLAPPLTLQAVPCVMSMVAAGRVMWVTRRWFIQKTAGLVIIKKTRTDLVRPMLSLVYVMTRKKTISWQHYGKWIAKQLLTIMVSTTACQPSSVMPIVVVRVVPCLARQTSP